MAALVYIVILLALTGHSSATYCVCKDGVDDAALQKAIDYACGAGADCTPILENGACYNPNTIKDHCNWAVNSYYQNKGGQTQLNCDDVFGVAATQTQQTTPGNNCVYPSNDLHLSNKARAALDAIAGIAVVAGGVHLLVSSVGNSKKKTMKAPGRNQQINRDGFESDTASYFKNLRKK